MDIGIWFSSYLLLQSRYISSWETYYIPYWAADVNISNLNPLPYVKPNEDTLNFLNQLFVTTWHVAIVLHLYCPTSLTVNMYFIILQ